MLGEFGPFIIQGARHFFVLGDRKVQHLTDFIDTQRVMLGGPFERDAHGVLAFSAERQAEADAHIDNRDDTAAQIDRALDLGWRHGNEGDFLGSEDILAPRTLTPNNWPSTRKVTYCMD